MTATRCRPTSSKACASRWPWPCPAGTTQPRDYLPAAARQAIVERDSGRCVLCDAPDNEIDHIDGDSSDPTTSGCCAPPATPASHCLTAASTTTRAPTQIDALFDQLTACIDEATPARACDADDWASNWRSWTAARGVLSNHSPIAVD